VAQAGRVQEQMSAQNLRRRKRTGNKRIQKAEADGQILPSEIDGLASQEPNATGRVAQGRQGIEFGNSQE